MNKFLLLFALIIIVSEFGCFSSKTNKIESLSCTNVNEVTIENEEKHLNSLDVNDLNDKERSAYYYDMGMLNYVKYGRNKDEESFLKSVNSFEKSWNEFGEKTSLNNLSILYYLHGDCDLARETIQLYFLQLNESEKKDENILRSIKNLKNCK